MNYILRRVAGLLFSIALLCTCQTTYAQLTTKNLLPKPDHIVIVILENHGYDEIIGSSAAPHINALASSSHAALFTGSYAIEHPSQPNYLDLFAGCNQGITDDSKPTNIPFTSDNLARELLDVGKTFITYSEDLPSVGYDGSSSGNYARKHNPAANWMGSGTNQIPTTTNKPFTAFPSDFTTLPTVCFVVPNQNNDMHNGTNPATITTADTWVNKNLNAYIQWANTHNSLLILTFDEDDNSQSNQIVTIFSGEMVLAGQYSETITHHSILRTIEDMYGLRYACNAATASPIIDSWTAASGVTNSKFENEKLTISPNPTTGIVTVHSPDEDILNVTVTNMLGENVLALGKVTTEEFTLDLSKFVAGTYIATFTTAKSVITRKIIRE